MATNYIQRGDNLTVIAADNVASNDPVQFGSINGVVLHDATIGEEVTIATVGVFNLPKVSADELATGDEVYLDASGLVTATAGTAPAFGVAVNAAAAGTGVVSVKIL